MAMETASEPTAPSAQLIGNAFVEQYYHILHHSPELVYRFYQDSSLVSRPDSKGEMTSVTTMQGINEKILSLNFNEFKAEIKTADAQNSHKDGVTVLVTGCLTGKDNKTRNFAQSFFLAPQDNGYFVLNDVFRYIEDHEPTKQHAVNGADDEAADTVTVEPEPTHASDSTAAPDLANSPVKEDPIVAESADEPPDHVERPIPNENEHTVELVQSNGNGDSQDTELDSSAQEDAPKKSYASIVKVQKASGPTKIYVPTNTIKTGPNKTEIKPAESVESAVVPEAAPDSVGDSESGDNQVEGEGEHIIYIRNMPMGVTAAEIEEGFKTFGPIKPRGIQIRNNKQQGYCFGFVEFQSQDSMNNAIQASPVNFAGRKVVVEMRKSTTRGGRGISNPGRARVPSSRRGGFRNDNNRGGGRGNYGVGRGFGRNDYRGGHGEFSGRGRSHGGSHGEGYQQVRARGPRSIAPKPNTDDAN